MLINQMTNFQKIKKNNTYTIFFLLIISILLYTFLYLKIGNQFSIVINDLKTEFNMDSPLLNVLNSISEVHNNFLIHSGFRIINILLSYYLIIFLFSLLNKIELKIKNHSNLFDKKISINSANNILIVIILDNIIKSVVIMNTSASFYLNDNYLTVMLIIISILKVILVFQENLKNKLFIAPIVYSLFLLIPISLRFI